MLKDVQKGGGIAFHSLGERERDAADVLVASGDAELVFDENEGRMLCPRPLGVRGWLSRVLTFGQSF